MTMASEKKGKKRSSKNEGHKSSKKPFLEEEEVENKILADVDQDEIDEVLAAQEFPMQKVSKKKKKESVTEVESEPMDGSNETPPAIGYLLGWKSKDKDWKFRKLRQTWLLQNIYDKEKVSKANFKILLEYLEDLKGAAREQTLKEAKEFVEANEDNEECTEKRKLKRSLNVLKVLT